MKKHRISAFSMRNTCAVTYCLPTKPACDEKPSYILRGLQIPILGTSGLQIRWDGVRTQRQNLESIDLQGLAPGQYLMKVTSEDGKTYSDKVVKE
jgi:hypothetical protein